MSRALPDIGFSLYPEDRAPVAPVSTFRSEGKVVMPQVVASASPFKTEPLPQQAPKMTAHDAARMEEASRTTLFSAPAGSGSGASPFGFSGASADHSGDIAALKARIATLETRLERTEASLAARIAKVESQLGASISEDRVARLEALVSDVIMQVRVLTPFNFDQVVQEAEYPSTNVAEVPLDLLFQNVVAGSPKVEIVSDFDAHDDGGVEESKEHAEHHEESNVRTISLASSTPKRRHTTKRANSDVLADIVSKVHGKTEKELNAKLKAQELSEMLDAFGLTYAPPKVEAVRALMKAAEEHGANQQE